MNGTEPTGGLEGVLAQLERLREEKEAERDAAMLAVAPLNEELRRLNAMIRAARGPKTGPKTKGERSPGLRFGEEELKIILRRIDDLADAADDIPGSFTTRSVADGLGMSKSTADRAINHLRDLGWIRMVGERVIGGSRASRVFVVEDHD